MVGVGFKRLLVTFAIASLFLPLGASDAPGPSVPTQPDCTPEHVEGIGPACLRENGLLEMFGRDGSSIGFTHGTDPVPHGPEPLSHARPVKCVNTISAQRDYYHMVVIYARAYNDADRYGTMAPTVRSLVEQANGLLYHSAQEVGRWASYRVRCANDVIEVKNVVLPTALGATSFSTIAQDLWAAGFTDGRQKLWVWFDDTSACSCGGTGHIYGDDRVRPDNDNNGNTDRPRVAVTFGYNSVRIMMHENGHNLGAVQNGSPESSGGWHCNDGYDIMCYADGGSTSNYRTTACSSQVFDCNHNDYFHPDRVRDPSYIGSHWNLGHPYNRYLFACFDGWATLNVPTPGFAGAWVATAFNSRTFDVPTYCRGHVFGVQALSAAGDLYDLDVCFYAGSGFLGCEQAILGSGAEEGRVPDAATHVQVRLKAGTSVSFLLRMA